MSRRERHRMLATRHASGARRRQSSGRVKRMPMTAANGLGPISSGTHQIQISSCSASVKKSATATSAAPGVRKRLPRHAVTVSPNSPRSHRRSRRAVSSLRTRRPWSRSPRRRSADRAVPPMTAASQPPSVGRRETPPTKGLQDVQEADASARRGGRTACGDAPARRRLRRLGIPPPRPPQPRPPPRNPRSGSP